MTRKLLGIAAAVTASAAVWATAAQALPITLGIQVNGGAITTGCSTANTTNPFGSPCDNSIPGVLSGGGSASVGGGTVSWTFGATGAPAVPNPEFLTNTINLTSSLTTATEVTVYITQQGVTAPTLPAPFLSSFTTNLLTGIDHITTSTYVDSGNGLFALTEQLGTATMTSPNTASVVDTPATLSAPFSETIVYDIYFNPGSGQDNTTVDLFPVPEPASLAILGSGLVGMGWIGRRRRRKSA